MRDDRCDLLCLDLPSAENIRRHLDEAAIAAAAARGKALGDPTRARIAAALRDGGELCVCDLAWITGRAENLVSHHLRTLRAAGRRPRDAITRSSSTRSPTSAHACSTRTSRRSRPGDENHPDGAADRPKRSAGTAAP